MAQQNLSDTSTWPVEKPKMQSNFDELYNMLHLPASTAASDFIVGNGATWTLKTLAETKTILSVPTALADLSADATHRIVTDVEKASWTAKAEKLRTEVVAATTKEFTLVELSGTFITNEGQVAASNITHTSIALVAGLEWSVFITETLDPGVYWQLTVPLGHSILHNGVMGTNNGYARFTAPLMGDVAHFKTVTINGSVVVICESSATSLTVV